MHKVHRRTTAAVILVSICLAAAGCTTTRTLPRPRTAAEAQTGGLKPGSKIVVTVASGDVRTFRVTAVEADALVGKDTRIAYADIEKLQVRKVSILRTTGAVMGVAVIALGLWVNHLYEIDGNE